LIGALLAGLALALVFTLDPDVSTGAGQAAAAVAASGAAWLVALRVRRAALAAPMLHSIEVDPHGRFFVGRGAGPEACAPVWLNRALLQLDGAGFRATVWRDSVDQATWRRLNALARWHDSAGGELPAPGAVLFQIGSAPSRRPGRAR